MPGYFLENLKDSEKDENPGPRYSEGARGLVILLQVHFNELASATVLSYYTSPRSVYGKFPRKYCREGP